MQKICRNCNVSKDIEQFNKKLSAASNVRKNICKDCEKLKRKISTHNVDESELLMLEDCQCPLCGNKAGIIHTDENGNKGSLCRSCNNMYSRYVNSDWFLKAENYRIMLRDFPFTRPYLFAKIDTDQMEFEFDG